MRFCGTDNTIKEGQRNLVKTRRFSSVNICGTRLSVVETGRGCTDGHLREETDEIFHVMKYPWNKNVYLHKLRLIRITRLLRITICERLSDSWSALHFGVVHIVKYVEFQIRWQRLCWQSDLWGLKFASRAWNFMKLQALLACISWSLRSDTAQQSVAPLTPKPWAVVAPN